ncbi:MAG: methyltransferase [Cytophaga sp.]|nr:methyltransferase [Cytophaga sp.]
MAIEIFTTSDGSHSLLNTELNETYHSTHGALRESVYVFINKGFEFTAERNQLTEMHILEIGFGTGLNALLTLQKSLHDQVKVHYTTLEAYPLSEEVWRNLNYAESLRMSEDFEKLHQATWNEWQALYPDFHLLKLQGTLQQLDLSASRFDVIYYDAFAPSKQPEMWELPVLEKVIRQLKPNGTFVTYCAKGQLKRDLKALGLQVETLEGPPGKKEMVRGVNQKN